MANKTNETNKVKNVPNVPKLAHIEVETDTFNNVISTATLTSSSMEKKVSELFGGAFDDFEGCKIVPVGEALKCKLYFKPCMAKTEDGVYAVKVRGEINKKKPSSFSEMVNVVNMMSTSKQFELEETAKELLSEFLVIPDAVMVDRYNEELDKVVKVRLPKNWNMFTEEVTDVIQNTRFQQPYLVVTVDLVLLAAKIWGKKDAKEVEDMKGTGIPKDRYQYQVKVVKVLNPTMYSFILEVRRIDIREMNALAQSIGYGMVSGNLVMTRR